MKIFKTASLIVSIACIMLFSNCKKDCTCNEPDADYLVFGDFYGMCAGETCVEIFKIENGNLYEDTKDQYPFGDSPYDGTYTALSATKYNLVSDLATHIPAQLLDETNNTIGIPDAYDQGGYYVEVKENGIRKYWLIDTNPTAIPAYLHAFTDSLNNYIDRISD